MFKIINAVSLSSSVFFKELSPKFNLHVCVFSVRMAKIRLLCWLTRWLLIVYVREFFMLARARARVCVRAYLQNRL